MIKAIVILTSVAIVLSSLAPAADANSHLHLIVDSCRTGFSETTVEWLQDDDYIVCIDGNSGATVVDTTNLIVHSYYPHQDILNVALNKNNSQLMTWGQDGFVRVWTFGNTDPIFTLNDGGFLLSANWSHDERFIITSNSDFAGTRVPMC